MLSLFLSAINSRKLLGYGLVFVIVFTLGWQGRGLIAERRLKSALASQQEALVKQCNENQRITEEANANLQTKLSAIGKRLAASKRLPATCVTVNPVMAEHPTSGGKYAGQNGLRSDWLREYAAECETYRTEVILLDDFGKKHCK